MQITVRLPVDEYREVALRARARGWSLSDYIGWCVVKELKPHKNGRGGQRDPLGLELTRSPLLAAHVSAPVNARLRNDDEFGTHRKLGEERG